MPTRRIHSKSSLIPSLVIFPFIQCHQTRGFAESGGLRKPAVKGSLAVCAATHTPKQISDTTSPNTRMNECVDLRIVPPLFFASNPCFVLYRMAHRSHL